MINLELLKEKTYEEGKKILEAEGYIEHDNAEGEGTSCDVINDTYFLLENDEEEEIETVSYAEYCNITRCEDGARLGHIIRAEWSSLTRQDLNAVAANYISEETFV